MADRMAQFWQRHPEARGLAPRELPELMYPKMFGEVSAPAALPDLLGLVGSWQPNVVVHDAGELAAPIAAKSVDAPHVTHSFGALLPEARVRAGAEEVAPLWRAQGIEPPPYGGLYDHLYVDIYPPSLQAPGGARAGSRQLLRPGALQGADETDATTDAIARMPGPLVYLTFGTVFNASSGDRTFEAFRAALEGIRNMEVSVVATVGPNSDPEILGPQPSNVVVARYIPQALLLPHCAIVVSHAGSGTVLATLASGLPQVCLPQAADQFLNAEAVARSGTGISLEGEAVDAAAVSGAVDQLLGEPRYGEHARRVAEEIAAMPAAEDAAVAVEALV
jgi:hypothetical protein